MFLVYCEIILTMSHLLIVEFSCLFLILKMGKVLSLLTSHHLREKGNKYI